MVSVSGPVKWLANSILIGRECYCSTQISGVSGGLDTRPDCTTTCYGSAVEICGAANRISIYTAIVPPALGSKLGPYSYVGCYSDFTQNALVILQGSRYPLDRQDMTTEFCGNYCTGYTYFGVTGGK